MKYEGTTYRPPTEADNPLLQVTVGCSHNSCAFCNMYRDVRFRKIPLSRIREDIAELRGIHPKAGRMFLVNGDAFALDAAELGDIADSVRAGFPECEVISTYASIRNIRAKSDGELSALARKGINDLYVGIESGWDEVLSRLNKGFTVEEARRELGRLRNAGLRYRFSLVLGAAGRGRGLLNARRTADFINETRPDLVWAGTLAIFEGTPLFGEMEKGAFVPAPELEVLEEEKALIRGIRLKNLPFYGNHPFNLVPLAGIIDRDSAGMADAIDAAIAGYGAGRLGLALDRSRLGGG